MKVAIVKPKEVKKPVVKTVVKKEEKLPDPDEIRKVDEVPLGSPKPVQRKPVNLAKMMERKIQQDNKPKKKTVSLRDIPGDEIFIPLTGPEIDFDDIIRKASPKLSRKEPSEDTPDVIYISLHSPPKEKNIEAEVRAASESVSGPAGAARSPGKTPKAYEVCDDGSIYIPLHTPDEEKNSRTFEEEIRRVEKELQRVKAAEAERRERERDQLKPATLDLTDNRSRLSQSYPGKQGILY